jgi:hypothetical protein
MNKDNSNASFWHQVAARIPDMFCKFNLLKNHKMAPNSATTYAREKISIALESVDFLGEKMFDSI